MVRRIEYIDALKGFSILLILYSHIDLFVYGHIQTFSFIEIGRIFMIPLFFFMSGFFLRFTSKCSYKESIHFLFKKFLRLIVPLLFFIIPLKYFTDFGISSYWFLITLFEFFFIFILIRSFPLRLRYINILLTGIGIGLIFFPLENIQIHPLFFLSKMNYFVYFIGGYFFKQYETMVKLFINNIYLNSLIVLICVLLISQFLIGANYMRNPLMYFLLSSLCITICWFLFDSYHSFFQSQHIVALFLKNIGKHTLEIYLIHYFFYPQKFHH